MPNKNEEMKITMVITMTSIKINGRVKILHKIIEDIEKGVNRIGNEEYSFETTLSPSNRISEFFNE